MALPHMTPARLERLRQYLDAGTEARFYWSSPWQRLRSYVLDLDRHECQICKARGRYSRADIVHHVKHLRERPDLALSVYDPDTGERQLISVCKACHEAEHPEALRRLDSKSPALTPERWD